MKSNDLFHTPEWVRDAVFYQIFPDRFAFSDRVEKPAHLEPWDAPPTTHGFKGGDLLGILEHMDYLEALGVNAIYLNPIFKSTANHRYHTYDYYEVDPILGGNDAFRSLLDAAHERSIRIVLDGVFNHASRGFFQFNHILENGPKSPYIDWFIVNGFPVNAYSAEGEPNYEAWWNLPGLPKLNTDHPPVREFLMGVAEHWLQEGIDGWRLDVPLEIKTPGFWEEFRRRCRRVNPQAYILAEIWEQGTEWLQGKHFDAVMNYPLALACLGFFGGQRLDTSFEPGGFHLRPLTGTTFADRVDQLVASTPWEVTLAQFNLIGSHDTPRFLTLVRGDKRRLRLAVLFQMTFPGPPSVYYGDEIGLEGREDPDCRRSFPWDEERWDTSLLDWFRRCIALRRDHASLRRGRFVRLAAGESVYAFGRQLGEEALVAAFNAGEETASIDLPVSELGITAPGVRDLLSEETWPVADGAASLTLSPVSGLVLQPTSEGG
jgi:glycosidase